VAEMYYTVDSIFGGHFSTYGRLYTHVEWDAHLPNVVNMMGRAKTVSLRSPSKPF
jgi:hypothetical protein